MKKTRLFPELREGLASGLPIIIGYLPIAIAYGILAKGVGLDLFHSFLSSAMVFAGASQFMALNLIAAGTGPLQIAAAAFLMNFRHFLMSASTAVRLENRKTKLLPVLAFGITDEVFSVAALRKGKISSAYLLTLEACAYIAWSGGTVLGYLAGELLPPMVGESTGIALYAMFIALLIPAIKNFPRAFLIAAASGGLNTLFVLTGILPSGWSLITAVVLSAGAAALLQKEVSE